MDKFILSPIEVLTDKRLSPMQLKVLLALLSFRGKNTNLVWPKRSRIAELVGCSENNVSRVTSELVGLGWLIKEGKGGLSKSTKYEVIVPDLDETLAATATVAATAGNTLAATASITLAATARGIEETNEETNEEKGIGRKQTRPKDKKNQFEEFWDAYPKKVGKKDCEKKWLSKKCDAIGALIISDVIHRKQRDVQWQDGFIPNPLTYLNGARWTDDIQIRRPVGVKPTVETWAKVPSDDGALWSWAKKHNYPGPGQMSYRQYRGFLLSHVEKRLDQREHG